MQANHTDRPLRPVCSARRRRWALGGRVSLRLELDDRAIDSLAELISERLQPPPAGSPWMNFNGLVEYTAVPRGTLQNMVADGQIPSHGGRTKIYHRDEVDEALLGYRRAGAGAGLRRVG